MDEKTFKVSEVAKKLRVSSRLLYTLIQDGRLKAFRVGHAIRIPESAVKAIVEQPAV